jgi:hypothetical protein
MSAGTVTQTHNKNSIARAEHHTDQIKQEQKSKQNTSIASKQHTLPPILQEFKRTKRGENMVHQ